MFKAEKGWRRILYQNTWVVLDNLKRQSAENGLELKVDKGEAAFLRS